MKKVKYKALSWLLTVAMVLAFIPAFTVEADALSTDGSGVYQIGSAQDLIDFATLVNGGNYSASAKLTTNINLGGTQFTPIAQNTTTDASTLRTKAYSGIFDGNGKTISGFSFSGAYNGSANGIFKSGLFGSVSGTIKNLVVEGAVADTSGQTQMAGFVGCSFGATILNCGFYGTVSGYAYGALVGTTEYSTSATTIYNCWSAASTTASGSKVPFIGNGDTPLSGGSNSIEHSYSKSYTGSTWEKHPSTSGSMTQAQVVYDLNDLNAIFAKDGTNAYFIWQSGGTHPTFTTTSYTKTSAGNVKFNVSTSSANVTVSPTQVTFITSPIITLSIPGGYSISGTPTVSMGGTPLSTGTTAGTYAWNAGNKTITVYNVTGALVISATATFDTIAVSGVTLDITAPKVGDIITATPKPDGANVTYQWYRGNNAITTNGNGQTYTVLADDYGQTLKCTVTGTGSYDGSQTSAATSAVAKKAGATTGPTGVGFTATGTDGGTLTGVNNTMEYSIDGGNSYTTCGPSPMTISGVTTAKGIKVRVGATTDTEASAPTSINVTAGAAANVSVNYSTETLNTTATMQYKIGAGNWTTCTADMAATAFGGWNGSAAVTVSFRTAPTGTALAGAEKTVIIPQRTATDPSVTINYTAETLNTANTMEYKVGAGSWRPCTAGMVATGFGSWNGTAAVTVSFRTAATANAFASVGTASVIIPKRPAAPAFVYDTATGKTTVAVPDTVIYGSGATQKLDKTGAGAAIDLAANTTYYFAYKANSGGFQSAVQTLTIAAAPTVPAAVTKGMVTVAGEGAGYRIKVTSPFAGQEYSFDEGLTWVSATVAGAGIIAQKGTATTKIVTRIAAVGTTPPSAASSPALTVTTPAKSVSEIATPFGGLNNVDVTVDIEGAVTVKLKKNLPDETNLTAAGMPIVVPTVDKLTIDLVGFNITGTDGAPGKAALTVDPGTELAITGTGTVKGGSGTGIGAGGAGITVTGTGAGSIEVGTGVKVTGGSGGSEGGNGGAGIDATVDVTNEGTVTGGDGGNGSGGNGSGGSGGSGITTTTGTVTGGGSSTGGNGGTGTGTGAGGSGGGGILTGPTGIVDVTGAITGGNGGSTGGSGSGGNGGSAITGGGSITTGAGAITGGQGGSSTGTGSGGAGGGGITIDPAITTGVAVITGTGDVKGGNGGSSTGTGSGGSGGGGITVDPTNPGGITVAVTTGGNVTGGNGGNGGTGGDITPGGNGGSGGGGITVDPGTTPSVAIGTGKTVTGGEGGDGGSSTGTGAGGNGGTGGGGTTGVIPTGGTSTGGGGGNGGAGTGTGSGGAGGEGGDGPTVGGDGGVGGESKTGVGGDGGSGGNGTKPGTGGNGGNGGDSEEGIGGNGGNGGLPDGNGGNGGLPSGVGGTGDPAGTTAASREGTPAAVIDYVKDRLTGLTAGAVYKIKAGATGEYVEYTADADGYIQLKKADDPATTGTDEAYDLTGATLSIVKKGDGAATVDSLAQSLIVAARPGSVDVVEVDGSGITTEKEKVTLNTVVTGQEYSIDGGTTWVTPSGTPAVVEFTGLISDEEYMVITRKAGLEGTPGTLASEPSTGVTVKTTKFSLEEITEKFGGTDNVTVTTDKDGKFKVELKHDIDITDENKGTLTSSTLPVVIPDGIELTIDLKGFDITGEPGEEALVIGTSGGAGDPVKLSVTDTGTPADGKIKGGDGVVPDGKGGAGISVVNPDTGNMITVIGPADVIGGNGSGTGSGGSGVTTTGSGKTGVTLAGAGAAVIGGDGGDAGGDGGDGINVTEPVTVGEGGTVKGGDGGNGGPAKDAEGTGGTGGNGGAGVTGTTGKVKVTEPSTITGGKGGIGGEGGKNGGVGGDGGEGVGGTLTVDPATTGIITGGSGGTGGRGRTEGGAGGTAGPATGTGATITGVPAEKLIPGTDGGQGSLIRSGGGAVVVPTTGGTVVVDGKEENIGTVESTDEETKVAVDAEKLTEKVEGAKAGSGVVINAIGPQRSISAQLMVQNVEQMAEKNMTLTVNAGKISYQIPTSAINTEELMKELGATDPAQVPLTVTIKNEAPLTVEGATVIGDPISFEVTAAYNGKSAKVESFDSYAPRMVEITADQAAKVTTAVAYGANGAVRHIPTEVYQQGGKYYAKINDYTNSTYVLICNQAGFQDTAGKWYEDVVTEMASRKIINGRDANSFDGGANITRAEFAAIIVRSLGLPVSGSCDFDDVAKNAWYYNAVGVAYEYGIIKGRSGQVFDPNAPITREEAMQMIFNASKIAEFIGQTGQLTAFSDAGSVSAWAKAAVSFNVGSGLIVGSEGMLNPTDNITRGETATVVLRLLQKAELVDVRTEV